MKKKKKKKIKFKFDFDKSFSKKFWIPKQLQDLSNPIEDTWFKSSRLKSITEENELINDIIINDQNKDIMRSKKIEIFFTKKQKQFLIAWTDIYRYYYNKTVRYFRSNKLISFNKIRKIIKDQVEKNTAITKIKKKFKVPSHTIDNAIKDVLKAYTSAIENLKRGNIRYFKLRYKKYKSSRQTITLENSSFSPYKERSIEIAKYKKFEDTTNEEDNFYQYAKYLFDFEFNDIIKINEDKLKNTFNPSVFGNYVKSSDDIKYVNHDSRLVYYKNRDKFFLFVPYTKVTTYKVDNKDICSLDPGKRTFQTCYTSNEVINIGNDCDKRLYREYQRLDYYDDLRKKNKKRCWNKKYHQIENKISNLIDELHYKTCNYLCKRFKCIVIGKLSTKNTNRRGTSNLNGMTKRILNRLGHYKFRQRLKSKCEEMGVFYYEVDESLTSKTCGNCGYKNNNLGGSKVYNCPKCKLVLDRDYNGARNILIKNYNVLDNRIRK